jgi:hypothetical protein
MIEQLHDFSWAGSWAVGVTPSSPYKTVATSNVSHWLEMGRVEGLGL